MLKRKEAASHPADFTEGEFRPLIGDDTVEDQAAVDTLLLCSGRITWDLMVERAKRADSARFAIARFEQLYPRPVDELEAEIAKYPGLRHIRWIQDEPQNMGPWPHYALNVWPTLDLPVEGVSRDESSSPSVGTVKRHTEEQKDLIARAFAPLPDQVREDY